MMFDILYTPYHDVPRAAPAGYQTRKATAGSARQKYSIRPSGLRIQHFHE
jgi:hypothetical protein